MVRLTLERMEASILHAFSEYEVQLDDDIRRAVAEYCQPENIKRVIADHVKRSLDATIKEEVDRFYRYGKGREVVRRALEETIAAGRETD